MKVSIRNRRMALAHGTPACCSGLDWRGKNGESVEFGSLLLL